MILVEISARYGRDAGESGDDETRDRKETVEAKT
jgi:hypothetical protein